MSKLQPGHKSLFLFSMMKSTIQSSTLTAPIVESICIIRTKLQDIERMLPNPYSLAKFNIIGTFIELINNKSINIACVTANQNV